MWERVWITKWSEIQWHKMHVCEVRASKDNPWYSSEKERLGEFAYGCVIMNHLNNEAET